MIQDIAPDWLDNAFVNCAPEEDEPVLVAAFGSRAEEVVLEQWKEGSLLFDHADDIRYPVCRIVAKQKMDVIFVRFHSKDLITIDIRKNWKHNIHCF